MEIAYQILRRRRLAPMKNILPLLLAQVRTNTTSQKHRMHHKQNGLNFIPSFPCLSRVSLVDFFLLPSGLSFNTLCVLEPINVFCLQSYSLLCSKLTMSVTLSLFFPFVFTQRTVEPTWIKMLRKVYLMYYVKNMQLWVAGTL